MKNKKFAIGTALLMAGSLLLTNCTKNKTNEPLSPDYETSTTKDVSKMYWMAADVFDIVAESSDGGILTAVHNASGTVVVKQGTTTVTHVNAGPPTIVGKKYTIVFNNTVGRDGHLRNGTIDIDYTPSPVPTATEFRHTEWKADITATNFSIDNYTISLNSWRISNTTPVGYPAAPNHPSVTPLTWNQSGTLTYTQSITDGTTTVTRSSSWSGSMDVKLLNHFNQPVPTPTAGAQTFTINAAPYLATLKWDRAYISYTGSGNGTLDGVGPYTSTITAATRNMNTSPETWYKDVSNMLITAEKHPFLSGTLTFKPGAKPTRDIDYGVATTVDYNAKMTIQGISYDVDCAELKE
jgi:hypothetical protein